MSKKGPVFILGAARSGTTLLYEALARHPAFSYITEAENNAYLHDYWRTAKGPLVFKALRLLKRVPQIDAEPEKPSEANGLWIHYLPYWKYVTEKDVTVPARRYFINNVDKIVEVGRAGRAAASPLSSTTSMTKAGIGQGAETETKTETRKGGRAFLNKNPHHCYRVRYLRAIWPDARFIHIVRNPRAVVLSEYKQRNRSNWDEEPVRDMLGPDYSKGRPFYNLAKEWKMMVRYAREVRPYELAYENLIRQPEAVMRALCEHLQIPFADEVVPRVQDMNVKFKRELSAKQITEIEDALQLQT